jgi:hypothetical protein
MHIVVLFFVIEVPVRVGVGPCSGYRRWMSVLDFPPRDTVPVSVTPLTDLDPASWRAKTSARRVRGEARG